MLSALTVLSSPGSPTRTTPPSPRLPPSDGQMKLHEALKPFLQLVHSSAKLREASFALVGHLLDAKISVGMNLKCVAFCSNLVNKTVSKIKKYAKHVYCSDGTILCVCIYISIYILAVWRIIIWK